MSFADQLAEPIASARMYDYGARYDDQFTLRIFDVLGKPTHRMFNFSFRGYFV